jgi:hypothetical protein
VFKSFFSLSERLTSADSDRCGKDRENSNKFQIIWPKFLKFIVFATKSVLNLSQEDIFT